MFEETARIIMLVDELVSTRVDDWRSSTMRVLCIEAGFSGEWLDSCSLETDRELTFKAAEKLGFSLT